jgi:hypothetical protein
MLEATRLYNQQLELNGSYNQAVKERDYYKGKAEQTDGLVEQITGLKQDLRYAYESVGALAKANASLLFDPDLKIENITPAQERLLQATRNYAAKHASNEGFDDIVQDIQKHYGLTKGIQNHIDELTPKPQTKKRSTGHSL